MKLAITILTGNRANLLKRTLSSFYKKCEALANEAHVTMLVNGADAATLRVTKKTPWIDHCHVRENQEGEIATIGVAISELMSMVPEDATHVMHLEDDWEFIGPGSGFLGQAEWLLRKHPEVGQVRLRKHAPPSVPSQRTMRNHMVTGRRILWKDKRASGGFDYRLGDAHLTFNPTLMRRAILADLFPCEGERDAARKFLSRRHKVVQLMPGVFRHIGRDDSLRERLGRQT